MATCPYLPQVERVWRATDMRPFRESRDGKFYWATLCYAQSLLAEGKPAQTLLQINKSFLADLSDQEILRKWPPAYQAVVWVIEQHRGQERPFLGNPVRHYQHLASRMSGARAEVRTIRAWACFHLAELVAPEFSRDHEQIEQEQITIPTLKSILEDIEQTGWKDEVNVLRGTLRKLQDRSI